MAGGGGGCRSDSVCSGNVGGDGGTPGGTSGTVNAACGTSNGWRGGGGATQTLAGVCVGYPDRTGQGMTGGYLGGGGGLLGGAGGYGAAGGGGSSKYATGAAVGGLTYVSGTGSYVVASSGGSGSVSITHTLGQNPWVFLYISDTAQSYKIPSGTQYLDFVVAG